MAVGFVAGFVGTSQFALLASTSGGEKSSDGRAFFLRPVCSVYSSRENLEFCEFRFFQSVNPLLTLWLGEVGAQGQAQ